MSDYWKGRGSPWEYDPGPPKNKDWAKLFAETPNYRRLGIEKVAGATEQFRWHFGPMFYRGRLTPNSVKVLVIGQEGGQDESLSHRAFTGGTGARLQGFVRYLGIEESYLFLNTFVYSIYGQYDASLKWLAQDPASPVVLHRHNIFNYVLSQNDVRLVVAVGQAAKESVVTWIKSRGGSCPDGPGNLTTAQADKLGAHTKAIGVMHPGSAGKGGSAAAVSKDFKKAIGKIKQWIAADASWLPADASGSRDFSKEYSYGSDPVPFRDFPYGMTWRLGRDGTSSNRKDQQRSIQVYSEGGKYNGTGVTLVYQDECEGTQEGYDDDPGDLPYEPPKNKYSDFDAGPGPDFARLLMGGLASFEWPDFKSLGVTSHPSFGWGPIYRGRPDEATAYILADQESHDDLFTGRALTGESGQRLQQFLSSMGILTKYVIIRTLPVDTLDLAAAKLTSISLNTAVLKVHQAILDRVIAQSPAVKLALSFGTAAGNVMAKLSLHGIPSINLKAWSSPGSLNDWKQKLQDIKVVAYPKETATPSFQYDGGRGEIPRIDLPFGVPRWVGTSGDRGSRPKVKGKLSPDYYKIYMPQWAFKVKPPS